MEAVREPRFKVEYAGKDITADVTRYLISCDYTDNTAKESDEISLHLEDTDGLWRGNWYPKKGDKISLKIGYGESLFPCGRFEVDEIDLQGPPDEITIRALAAGINSPIRTLKSKAFDSQTLRQIAQKVADDHGYTLDDANEKATVTINFNDERDALTRLYGLIPKANNMNQLVEVGNTAFRVASLIGDKGKTVEERKIKSVANKIVSAYSQVSLDLIPKNQNQKVTALKSELSAVVKATGPVLQNFTRTVTKSSVLDSITIERVTQNRETDLEFLNRISKDYGIMFSVRETKLLFTSIYGIEKLDPVLTIDRTDLISYSIRDKSVKTYKSAKLKYKNPKTNQVVEAEVKSDDINVDTEYETASDTLELKIKADNKQQAEEKARARLHMANTKNQEGTLTVEGNPLLVAGNSFVLTGMGQLSGKWHIKSSTHRINTSGYTTDVDIKRIGKPKSDAQKVRKVEDKKDTGISLKKNPDDGRPVYSALTEWSRDN